MSCPDLEPTGFVPDGGVFRSSVPYPYNRTLPGALPMGASTRGSDDCRRLLPALFRLLLESIEQVEAPA